jgi:site-specific recombinase XerD
MRRRHIRVVRRSFDPASELRLPVTVPNPAHTQFIARYAADPRDQRRALLATRTRQLLTLPKGSDIFEVRDWAILQVFLYTGVRIETTRQLDVADFRQHEEEATLRIHEKGDKRRTVGLHFQAANAVQTYLEHAGLRVGPLFRARLNSRSPKLGNGRMSKRSLYRLLMGYLERLPKSIHEVEDRGRPGQTRRVCLYWPHSLRATTATLLLDAGEDIRKVQELLGHRHITTMQVYDKRRRAAEGASHSVPI